MNVFFIFLLIKFNIKFWTSFFNFFQYFFYLNLRYSRFSSCLVLLYEISCFYVFVAVLHVQLYSVLFLAGLFFLFLFLLFRAGLFSNFVVVTLLLERFGRLVACIALRSVGG